MKNLRFSRAQKLENVENLALSLFYAILLSKKKANWRGTSLDL